MISKLRNEKANIKLESVKMVEDNNFYKKIIEQKYCDAVSNRIKNTI